MFPACPAQSHTEEPWKRQGSSTPLIASEGSKTNTVFWGFLAQRKSADEKLAFREWWEHSDLIPARIHSPGEHRGNPAPGGRWGRTRTAREKPAELEHTLTVPSSWGFVFQSTQRIPALHCQQGQDAQRSLEHSVQKRLHPRVCTAMKLWELARGRSCSLSFHSQELLIFTSQSGEVTAPGSVHDMWMWHSRTSSAFTSTLHFLHWMWQEFCWLN